MKTTLLLLLSLLALSADENFTFKFGNSTNQCRDWVMISDNIMGGVTRSKLEYTNNSLLLSGSISLDNFGGFSSIKTQFGKYDLSEYKGVKIRFKSTGQQFAFTLENSQNWTRPNFKGDFAAKKENTWEVVILYFKNFKEYQIGEPTGNPLNPASLKNMVRLGIITTAKKEGPFSLEVDYVEFFR